MTRDKRKANTQKTGRSPDLIKTRTHSENSDKEQNSKDSARGVIEMDKHGKEIVRHRPRNMDQPKM